MNKNFMCDYYRMTGKTWNTLSGGGANVTSL